MIVSSRAARPDSPRTRSVPLTASPSEKTSTRLRPGGGEARRRGVRRPRPSRPRMRSGSTPPRGRFAQIGRSRRPASRRRPGDRGFRRRSSSRRSRSAGTPRRAPPAPAALRRRRRRRRRPPASAAESRSMGARPTSRRPSRCVKVSICMRCAQSRLSKAISGPVEMAPVRRKPAGVRRAWQRLRSGPRPGVRERPSR